jgi:DNA-binding CsgD family transcriptional regulator
MHAEDTANTSHTFGSRIRECENTLVPLLVFLDALDEGTALLMLDGALMHQNHALEVLLASEPEAMVLLDAARRFGSHSLGSPASLARQRRRTGRANDLRILTQRATYSVRAIPLPTGPAERAPILLLITRAGIVLPSLASLRRKFRLTTREAEVALLLAKGASDAEVARWLGMSVHTARHHGEHVFAKIGIHSRKALALHLA